MFMEVEKELSKVRIHLNKMSNSKIQITCMKPILGGAGHARPYDSEEEAKKTLIGLGLREDEVLAYLVALRDMSPMELMNLGDYDISDAILRAVGFSAV